MGLQVLLNILLLFVLYLVLSVPKLPSGPCDVCSFIVNERVFACSGTILTCYLLEDNEYDMLCTITSLAVQFTLFRIG